eukprot:198916-Pleurochrysis_carterae.AAC.1
MCPAAAYSRAMSTDRVRRCANCSDIHRCEARSRALTRPRQSPSYQLCVSMCRVNMLGEGG